jgi:hypothetical protein
MKTVVQMVPPVRHSHTLAKRWLCPKITPVWTSDVGWSRVRHQSRMATTIEPKVNSTEVYKTIASDTFSIVITPPMPPVIRVTNEVHWSDGKFLVC